MTKPKLEDFPHPQGGYSNLSFHNALIVWQEAEIGQLRGNLSLAEDGLASAMQEIAQLKLHAAEAEREMLSQSEKRQLAQMEIDRLREVLTIPLITPDTTSSAFFIRVLSEHEKGLPVNAMDLINALMWRVKNQRKEIARLHERNRELQSVGQIAANRADDAERGSSEPECAPTRDEEAFRLLNATTYYVPRDRELHADILKWMNELGVPRLEAGEQRMSYAQADDCLRTLGFPGSASREILGAPAQKSGASETQAPNDLIVSVEEAKKPLAFRHWTKDTAIPYADCHCATCVDVRAALRTNE